MFQYTNTIILNSLVDELSGKDKVQDLKDAEGKEIGIHVLRVNPFKKENVCAMYKRPYEEAVAGSVAIGAPGLTKEDSVRLYMYVRLSGSQNSYYANDFVFKGKPFVYEFKGSDTVQDMVKKIRMINNIYEDRFLKVEEKDGKLTFTGDNYTRFTEAKLQKFVPKDNDINGGEWVDIDNADITVTECVNGFGTYEHILKDLRLPTMDSRRFEAVNKEELPIPGGKYTQYTVHYATKRGILGTDAVGHLVKSKTTHVFYVLDSDCGDSNTAKFEEMLKKLEHDDVKLEEITKPEKKEPTPNKEAGGEKKNTPIKNKI